VTASASTRRRVTTIVGAVAVALGLLSLAACGVPLDDNTHRIAADDVPSELLEPAPTTSTTTTAPVGETTTTTTPARERVVLYFVRNDRVDYVTRVYSEPLGMKARLLELSKPLLPEEIAQNLRSAVPENPINDVVPSGGVATVDLTPAFAELPTNEQVLAFAQITYTLLQTPGIGQVSFTLDGVAIQPLDDEATVVPGPVTKETYDRLLATHVAQSRAG
jgi:spore germination protein GerM